jgi:hypothetical protein
MTNPLWDRIHDKMRYELHHNDNEERPDYADRYEDVPLLPRELETIQSHNNCIS